MSHGLAPYSVNLSQICKVVGSRSKSSLRELREEFEDELTEDREQVEQANQDDEFDPELRLDRALRHLIMDEERWDYEGPKYGRAVEMLCSFYGHILPNDHWTEWDLAGIDAVSEALQSAGPESRFSISGHLIRRGSPVQIPEISDFPYIGYLKATEVPIVLNGISDKKLSSIKQADAERVVCSLRQLREWLEACQRDKTDLICFFY